MDYINHQSFHSEAAIHAPAFQKNDLLLEQKSKTDAFAMMDQLEGWCSKLKASMLMDLIFTYKPKVVVEVGVFGGKSFIPMAQALGLTGGMIYGIDPWKNAESAVGMEDENFEYWEKLDHEMILNGFLKKINEFKLENQISIIRATSADAEPIQNIDLIHIDGNHSEETSYFDVLKWVPLVRSGGIIIFDDLDWDTTQKAVAWLDENCTRITQVQDINIWGIWVKK